MGKDLIKFVVGIGVFIVIFYIFLYILRVFFNVALKEGIGFIVGVVEEY